MQKIKTTTMLLLLMLGVAASSPLSASTLFKFTDSGNGILVSGTLTGVANGDGSYTITAGTGFFNGAPITIYAGSGISPLGLFSYDNLLFPNENPKLHIGGLLFTFDGTTNEINIWGTGPGSYSSYTGIGGGYPIQNTASEFEVAAATPEPGTLAMLGVGLTLAMIGRWRRKKTQAPA